MTGSKRKTSYLTRFALCACLLVCIAFPCPVRAEAAQDGETVRVGYYENEVFQEGAQEGAVKTGYAYEYYQKISEYTGWRYEYEYGEFGDLYQMLLDGKIDLLAGLARTDEREPVIGYPDAAMGNETYNLVKHDDDEDITAEPATLTGKKIGVLDSAMADVLTARTSEQRMEKAKALVSSIDENKSMDEGAKLAQAYGMMRAVNDNQQMGEQEKSALRSMIASSFKSLSTNVQSYLMSVANNAAQRNA